MLARPGALTKLSFTKALADDNQTPPALAEVVLSGSQHPARSIALPHISQPSAKATISDEKGPQHLRSLLLLQVGQGWFSQHRFVTGDHFTRPRKKLCVSVFRRSPTHGSTCKRHWQLSNAFFGKNTTNSGKTERQADPPPVCNVAIVSFNFPEVLRAPKSSVLQMSRYIV